MVSNNGDSFHRDRLNAALHYLYKALNPDDRADPHWYAERFLRSARMVDPRCIYLSKRWLRRMKKLEKNA